jgi:Trypsin-co-occurring domain 1
MAYLLEVPLEGGGRAVVEVDGAEVSAGLELASPGPGQVAARAQRTLQESLSELQLSLKVLLDRLAEIGPDEVVVEFGLKLGGETGVIIAKGNAEVNFAVSLTWRRG